MVSEEGTELGEMEDMTDSESDTDEEEEVGLTEEEEKLRLNEKKEKVSSKFVLMWLVTW